MAVFKSLDQSFTSRCMQYGWGAKHYFPCCPKEITATAIDDYFKSLKIGATHAYHDNAPKLITNKFVKIKNNSSILILCERDGDWCERLGLFPWVICEITLENGFFTHYKVEEFFEKAEADQEFCTRGSSPEPSDFPIRVLLARF
ncbi:MAG: hypothetical protein KBB94_08275 [Legionellaceae bacterium]|nr:hypothetical protein [Legionellaceae bacterium]MBP9775626.1 hypothetical protein [Legionellaceae bacterium]